MCPRECQAKEQLGERPAPYNGLGYVIPLCGFLLSMGKPQGSSVRGRLAL